MSHIEQVVWEPDTRGRTPCQLNMRLGISEQSLGDWKCTLPNFQRTASDLSRGSLPAFRIFEKLLRCWICRALHSSAVFWSLRLWALLFPGTFGM